MPSIGAAKQALLLAQIMHTAAYSALNVARPLRPVQLPSLRPQHSHKVVLQAAAEASDDAVDDAPAPTGPATVWTFKFQAPHAIDAMLFTQACARN